MTERGGPEAPDGHGFGEVAASLRAEWRDEASAAAADAYDHWRHRRSLVDVLAEVRHRGGAVSITVAGRTHAGPVVEVGGDLVALRTPIGRVDVHVAVPHLLTVLDGPDERSAAPAPAAGSLRGRLLALEAAGTSVVVTTTVLPEPCTGTVVVGADHVGVARDGEVVHVPLAAVAVVHPAPPD